MAIAETDENIELIESAYKKLKQLNYYDTVNLFLRHQIAQFETSSDFQKRLKRVKSVIDQIKSNGIENNNLLKKWIEAISFRCLPKSFKKDEENETDKICYISNVRTTGNYDVDSVNYFIDAPIELHIIDIIWSMEVGTILDKELDQSCLGNRLERTDEGEYNYDSGRLFKIFFRQYAKWRDTAIEKAQKALENDTNVLIIGLDIKQCYYHIETEFEGIFKAVIEDRFKTELSKIIQKVITKYHEVIKKYLKLTHPTAESIKGLPVGLSSSHIIANWMLGRFDRELTLKLKPLYYGRYVDDMLLVLQSPSQNVSTKKGCESNVNELFIKNELFEDPMTTENGGEKKEYSLKTKGLQTLKIQNEKLIFQYFDSTHSHAGLKEFSREIMEKASEFRFLPVGGDLQGLDDSAYDLVYKGSVNKLRSVVGLEENSTELSKYLSRKIIQYYLCRDGLREEQLDQLFRFYKGRNIFDFCRLWEKVFTLLLTNHKEIECTKFYKTCFQVISKINGNSQLLIAKLKNDTNLYLNLSLAVPLGLLSLKFATTCKSRMRKLICNHVINNSISSISSIAKEFRQSNMIRHAFVFYPLLNYTSYDGDLVTFLSEKLPTVSDLDWDIRKMTKYTPRYIHYDEIQLFTILQCLLHRNKLPEDYIDLSKKLYLELNNNSNSPVEYKKNGNIRQVQFPSQNNDKFTECVIVGIANMKVSEVNIQNAYKPMRKQNLSYRRQSDLYTLLNSAVENELNSAIENERKKGKCDIIVFPELSIPFVWVPIMVSFARKHQMGIVFGVEHVVIKDKAHNLVFTVLPFKNEFNQNECFISARLKNHYAPSEEDGLRIYGIEAVKPNEPYYELFRWKGVTFSVFNCFELTNIKHRGLMQSELDFLITVAWNKDTSYYDHILTATCRDLHCYIIHANTSQYGDSRITAPRKQEEMDYVRVKGGISSVLMKAELDIKELRDFQIKIYDPNDNRFKPTPAGYNHSKVRTR